MRILLLSAAPCVNDARPRFAAAQLADLGHDVILVCRAAPGEPERENLSGARLIRVDFDALAPVFAARAVRWPTRLLAAYIAFLRRISDLIGWRGAARLLALTWEFFALAGAADAVVQREWQGRFDMAHGSGLAALPGAGRLATAYGARLVYDSIELECGRNARYFPPFKWLRLRLERWWIRRCHGCAAVSADIARQLARDYGVRRPMTIHNVGPRMVGAPGLRRAFAAGGDAPIAVYVGAAASDRGLEASIAGAGATPGLRLAIVGPLTEQLEDRYGRLIDAAGIRDRLYVGAARPPAEAAAFISDGDIALAMAAPSCASYVFALPNKLFYAVQAGLPILVGRTRALREAVANYGIGEAVDERDTAAVSAAMRRLAERKHEPSYARARAVFLTEHGAAAMAGAWARLYAHAAAARETLSGREIV